MATSPFVIHPAATAVAVAYPQGERIADKVLPRVPVNGERFTYSKYAKGDAFRTPDTRVGRKSAPNQLDFGQSEVEARCVDQALDFPIPNKDIKDWREAKAAKLTSAADPLIRGTELTMGAVLNRREKRTADLVLNPANYATDNKITLSGNSQWSDFTNSDPLGFLKDTLDNMLVRPNHAAMGRKVWSKLSRHPKVILGLYGSASTRGSARLEDLAQELELIEISIGDAWLDTSVVGQASNIQRAWGPDALFYYRAEQAATEGVLTFGFTAQHGSRVSGSIDDPDIGMHGGIRQRTGESVVELITANDLAYLVKNAVA